MHILYQHLESNSPWKLTHIGALKLPFPLWEDNYNRAKTDKWCFDVNNEQTDRSIHAEQGMLHLRLYWLTAKIVEWQNVLCFIWVMVIAIYKVNSDKTCCRRSIKDNCEKSICKHLHESKCLRNNQHTLIKKNTCHTYLFSICNRGPGWPSTTLLL